MVLVCKVPAAFFPSTCTLPPALCPAQFDSLPVQWAGFRCVGFMPAAAFRFCPDAPFLRCVCSCFRFIPEAAELEVSVQAARFRVRNSVGWKELPRGSLLFRLPSVGACARRLLPAPSSGSASAVAPPVQEIRSCSLRCREWPVSVQFVGWAFRARSTPAACGLPGTSCKA